MTTRELLLPDELQKPLEELPELIEDEVDQWVESSLGLAQPRKFKRGLAPSPCYIDQD
jgi:hypothetical protein